MSWDVQVPFLSEISFEVFRCLVYRRLIFSGKGYQVFAGRRYQRGHGLGSIFGGLFKAAMPLLIKGTKTLEREALKTGLNIAGDVVQGRNIKQTVKSRLKSTGESLLQKAMDTVGPPGQRVIKEPAKRKRPDVGRTSNGTHRMIFRIRMVLVHPNSCECTKSELDLFEVPPTQTSVAYGYWEQKASPAIFNPIFKASRSRVFAPFFNKGMAALKSPPKILPSPCPL
jgi:hypothetical protein